VRAHRRGPFGRVRRIRERQPGHRIDDAEPTVIVSADAGSRAGKVIAYKPLLDEAIRLAKHPPKKVLLVDRRLAPMERVASRDVDHAALRERHLDDVVPCTWVDSDHPSYTLYTSGTTGSPEGRAARHRAATRSRWRQA
jgi:propionyl-CoA synthetase